MPAVVETAAPARTATMRGAVAVPAMIANAGDHAARRFLEFFAANKPIHVAAYVEALQETAAKPTVKQHLAAIRMPCGESGACRPGP